MNSTRVRVTDFLKAKLYDAGSEPVFIVTGGLGQRVKVTEF